MKKKKLIYTSSAIIIIAITATATCLSLQTVLDSQTDEASATQQTSPDAAQQKADSLKNNAIEAMKTHKTDQAKQLFNEALAIYQSIGDDAAIADVNLQLSILSAAPTTSQTPPSQPLTTSAKQ